MSPPTTICYVLDLGSSVKPFLTCIAIAVKAKFQLVVMVESHYCNFDRPAYKLNKLANAVFHFCKVTGSNASRCVKEEQDVLSSARIAVSSLSTKSMVVLVPFKRHAGDLQLVVVGYCGVLKSVLLYEAVSLHVRIVYL